MLLPPYFPHLPFSQFYNIFGIKKASGNICYLTFTFPKKYKKGVPFGKDGQGTYTISLPLLT